MYWIYNKINQLLNTQLFPNTWENIYNNYYPVISSHFFPMILMTSSFLILNVPFMFFDFSKWQNVYKIQTNRYPSKKLYMSSVYLWLTNELYVNLPLTCLPIILHNTINITKDSLILKEFIYDTFMTFLLMDFLFFALHYILHTQFMFKHIHYVHHKYKYPFGFVGQAIHPIEGLLFGMVSIIPIKIFSKHFITQNVMLLFVMMNNIDSHSGYYFININKWSNEFLSGSISHDRHHLYSNVNYSIYTTIWDRIMDTTYKSNDKLKDLK